MLLRPQWRVQGPVHAADLPVETVPELRGGAGRRRGGQRRGQGVEDQGVEAEDRRVGHQGRDPCVVGGGAGARHPPNLSPYSATLSARTSERVVT